MLLYNYSLTRHFRFVHVHRCCVRTYNWIPVPGGIIRKRSRPYIEDNIEIDFRKTLSTIRTFTTVVCMWIGAHERIRRPRIVIYVDSDMLSSHSFTWHVTECYSSFPLYWGESFAASAFRTENRRRANRHPGCACASSGSTAAVGERAADWRRAGSRGWRTRRWPDSAPNWNNLSRIALIRRRVVLCTRRRTWSAQCTRWRTEASSTGIRPWWSRVCAPPCARAASCAAVVAASASSPHATLRCCQVALVVRKVLAKWRPPRNTVCESCALAVAPRWRLCNNCNIGTQLSLSTGNDVDYYVNILK